MRRLAVIIAICALSIKAEAQMPFPCGKLSKGEYRIVSGLGPADTPASAVPVRIRKGATVLKQRRPLLTATRKPEGLIGAMVPYQAAQLLFRPYRIDGEPSYCADGRRDDVFGDKDREQHYSLRCLVDQELDGTFEAYRRYGELVRIDNRTGKTDPPSGVEQSDEKLVKPFSLVSAEGAQGDQRFGQHFLSSLHVKSLAKDMVTISLRSYLGLGMELMNKGFREGAKETIAEIPLREGFETIVDGTKLRISRSKRDWFIAAPEGLGGQSNLLCGGSVFYAGGLYNILYAGGFAAVSQSQLDSMSK
jgi:hypothetical protein